MAIYFHSADAAGVRTARLSRINRRKSLQQSRVFVSLTRAMRHRREGGGVRPSDRAAPKTRLISTSRSFPRSLVLSLSLSPSPSRMQLSPSVPWHRELNITYNTAHTRQTEQRFARDQRTPATLKDIHRRLSTLTRFRASRPATRRGNRRGSKGEREREKKDARAPAGETQATDR